MVEYLRHYAASFVIFAAIVTLFINIYTPFVEVYGITPTATDDEGYNIMEALQNLNIISALSDMTTAVYRIANPQNALDLLGAMALVGFGALRTVGAIVLLPIDILVIVTGFYPGIPAIIPTIVGVLSALYVGFILLSAYLRERV